jgi:5'-3' exonuclease
MSVQFLEQSVKFGKSDTDTVESFIQELETYCGLACEMQRGCNWYIGDLCNAAESVWRRRKLPGDWQQVVPVWASPGHIDRCRAVAKAYKAEERNPLATWSVHMHHANDPNRIALVQAAVDAGQTSDENRKDPALPEPVVEPEPTPVEEHVEPQVETQEEVAQAEPEPENPRWLLAVDINYYIHRYFHSGAGVESAKTFDEWLSRTIGRLVEKGLTDVVCCVDSHTSFRKQLTEGWEAPYKPRAEKDAELAGQLRLAPELLKARNLPVVSIEGMEADDVMASYAIQFPGRVTLLTQDKDMRQCLSQTCNILQDVTWEQNPETGQHLPKYKWVSLKQHIEEGSTYSGTKVIGINAELWPHFQAIAGDSTDGIRGCEGIGGKGAMDLVLAHGTVQDVIEACKDGSANLKPKKIDAVLEFEAVAETMLKLTTLRTDLTVPWVTTLQMKEST